MSLWGLWGDKKKAEFKKFEKDITALWKSMNRIRQADKRNAFMTPDILRRRKDLTKNGKLKLILDYGSKDKRIYTLAKLNEMLQANRNTIKAHITELLRRGQLKMVGMGKGTWCWKLPLDGVQRQKELNVRFFPFSVVPPDT